MATDADAWKLVSRAEELGFTSAWFYDTQMLSADCFVAMGAAAVKTARIRLGTGVLIPPHRIAPVTANALASLNKLAPGRIDFGVGTGFTGRRAMGLGAMKLADMEAYIEIVEGLIRGETLETEFEGKTRKIRFLNPDLGLINTADPIPLHVSAYGPRSRALTAKLGAGWLYFAGDVDTAATNAAAMRDAWTAAGRSTGDARRTVPAADSRPVKLCPTPPSVHLLGLASPVLRRLSVRRVDIAQGLRSFDRTGYFPRRAALRWNTKAKP